MIGGIKNALDRGETLSKAKKSFINAGYSPKEVRLAVQRMPTSGNQIVKPISTKQPQQKSQPQQIQPQSQQPKQESSKKMIIILSIIGIVILVIAGLLGVFWEDLF